MYNIKTIEDFVVDNKTIILRIDLNLPRIRGKVSDDTRITKSLKTIEYLIARKAKIIIIAHLGRPKGKFDIEQSLAPMADELAKHLKRKIKFCPTTVDSKAYLMAKNLMPQEILLLENLRFSPYEEENDFVFAQKLAKLGDLFVNDAFSCSHRAHASIVGITKFIPSCAGFLLLDELKNIHDKLSVPKKPFTTIIGGAKVSSKLSLLSALVKKLDNLIIAGAMANSFLYAQKYQIGKSLNEPNLANEICNIIKLAKNYNCNLLLPVDVMVVQNQATGQNIKISNITQIDTNDNILDVGPKTVANIINIVNQSQTLVYNGPLGKFETPPFDISTNAVARVIADNTINKNLISFVGGGDTIAAIKSIGLLSCYSYSSTGGGAFLEWLKGKMLPGIEVLKVFSQ